MKFIFLIANADSFKFIKKFITENTEISFPDTLENCFFINGQLGLFSNPQKKCLLIQASGVTAVSAADTISEENTRETNRQTIEQDLKEIEVLAKA